MIAACITAKNEADTIIPLVTMLARQRVRVIIVDDGSNDSTGYRAAKAGALMIRHDLPRGIGPSLLEAWDFALNLGADEIIQLDAGGSHDPRQVKRLLGTLQRADMVIGSRFMPGATYIGNPRREQMSRLASRMCNLVTGQYIADWTSGYRAFRREAIEKLLHYRYEAKMHGWQIEVLGNAIKEGLRIAEVPITYTAGESSFNKGVAWEAFQAWQRL